MSNVISYKLTDEIADVGIPAGYDPIQEKSFEEYIHISEKANFSKKDLFNNMPNKQTKDLYISGLFLNWGFSMPKKLKTLFTTCSIDFNGRSVDKLTGRDNIENLYMYADTVRIDSYLHMPQTNVFIYARRLIIGENGILDSSPLGFSNPNAQGGTEEKGMAHGLNANDAGNINIFADNIELSNRPFLKVKNNIKLCDPPIIQNGARIIKPIFSKDLCMVKGDFEFELDTKDTGEIYFIFTNEIPKDGKINLDKTRHLKLIWPGIPLMRLLKR